MNDRPYQTAAKAEVERRFLTENEVVLAACPSAGKTKMAMDIIVAHPEWRVTVLAHSTNVIKTQWGEKFVDADIKAHKGYSPDARVNFALPQNLYRRQDVQGDLLIIDEAHENNFVVNEGEGMVDAIRGHFTKVLYLTGTPSKFVRRGIKPIVVPAVDLVPEYVSDLYFGLASTNALISGYNRNDDVDIESANAMLEAVDDDMKAMLRAIHKRLRGILKTYPTAKSALGWLPTLGRLHKTMVATTSVSHAALVERFFQDEGVTVVSSNYENDPDSDNIERFRTDPSIRVLVVVDRGILGFDMQDLVNVIDMTCSRNIDRIYQLYARVMRKSADYPHKFFFKLVPEGQQDLGKFYMTAALMLMHGDFISRYNGKNLNGMEVVVRVEPHKPRREGDTKRQRQPGKKLPIDAFYADTVSACKLLTDILNKAGRGFNEYAKATIANCKRGLGQNVKERLTTADFHALAASMVAKP